MSCHPEQSLFPGFGKVDSPKVLCMVRRGPEGVYERSFCERILCVPAPWLAGRVDDATPPGSLPLANSTLQTCPKQPLLAPAAFPHIRPEV